MDWFNGTAWFAAMVVMALMAFVVSLVALIPFYFIIKWAVKKALIETMQEKGRINLDIYKSN